MSFAQKSTIGVSNPTVNGLYATPEIASKIIQLELTKIDQFTVYDQFDINEVYEKDSTLKDNCHSRNCLVRMGKQLNANLMVTGSYDLLGEKIAISLKFIDVKSETVKYSGIGEFNNQESELQRMTEIVIQDILGLQKDAELVKRLTFNNDPITANKVGQINNSGPRIGVALMTGNIAEFATRSTRQGGLGVEPVVSMIGYQFEAQYIGTENFSALGEFIFNVSGLEQGLFIPSLSIMNGFRFGNAGWEFAFGPGFGLKRVGQGFIDVDGRYGDKNEYFGQEDWYSFATDQYADANEYPEYHSNGYFRVPSIEEVDSEYTMEDHADTRGRVAFSTSFLMAFGRTFRAGSLNIPVNVFYSARKGGGYAGINVGFNVTKSKKSVKTVR
jgi:hypothetical protein